MKILGYFQKNKITIPTSQNTINNKNSKFVGYLFFLFFSSRENKIDSYFINLCERLQRRIFIGRAPVSYLIDENAPAEEVIRYTKAEVFKSGVTRNCDFKFFLRITVRIAFIFNKIKIIVIHLF